MVLCVPLFSRGLLKPLDEYTLGVGTGLGAAQCWIGQRAHGGGAEPAQHMVLGTVLQGHLAHPEKKCKVHKWEK